MVNFCLFVFVIHAVRDSAQEIVFGKQKKSAVQTAAHEKAAENSLRGNYFLYYSSSSVEATPK